MARWETTASQGEVGQYMYVSVEEMNYTLLRKVKTSTNDDENLLLRKCKHYGWLDEVGNNRFPLAMYDRAYIEITFWLTIDIDSHQSYCCNIVNQSTHQSIVPSRLLRVFCSIREKNSNVLHLTRFFYVVCIPLLLVTLILSSSNLEWLTLSVEKIQPPSVGFCP